MRNTLGDLNNHLFAQLERLGDEDLKGDLLSEEICRAKAVTGIASQIIANGTLVLKGKSIQLEYGMADESDKKIIPPMLKGDFLKE